MKLPYLDLDQLGVNLQEVAEVMGATLRPTGTHTVDAMNRVKAKLEIIEQCLRCIVMIEVMNGDETAPYVDLQRQN